MPSSHNSAYLISFSRSEWMGFYWDRSLVVSPAAEISAGIAVGADVKRSRPISLSPGFCERASQRKVELEAEPERGSNRSKRNIGRLRLVPLVGIKRSTERSVPHCRGAPSTEVGESRRSGSALLKHSETSLMGTCRSHRHAELAVNLPSTGCRSATANRSVSRERIWPLQRWCRSGGPS